MLAAFVCLGKDNPNAVFIFADDMSRDTWGAYGGKECKTPNIDRLAKDGARFDRAYCTVAMCALQAGTLQWSFPMAHRHIAQPFEIGGWHQECSSLPETSWLSGCSARKISRRSERMLSLRAAGDASKKVDANPETLTKARAFLDDCKKSDNPFASSSVPMIPTPPSPRAIPPPTMQRN